MLKNDIILFLNNNLNIVMSGELIAKNLGVSRMSISKNIKVLKEEGFDINIIANKGYVLKTKIDILNEDIMKSIMRHDIDIYIFDTIDSTNTYAKNHLCDNNKTSLVVSDFQSAGRGRFNKEFYSPRGTGIYMSLVVPVNKSFEAIKHLTCAVSVVVAKVVESFGSDKVGIKWVNDLYVNDKKFCGILTEATTNLETATVNSVVIGIGINLNTIDFPSSIKATSLNIEATRNELIANIVNGILELNNYEDTMQSYIERSILTNCEITYTYNNITNTGIVKCINDDGNLVVNTVDGEVILHSGEVSIGSNNI